MGICPPRKKIGFYVFQDRFLGNFQGKGGRIAQALFVLETPTKLKGVALPRACAHAEPAELFAGDKFLISKRKGGFNGNHGNRSGSATAHTHSLICLSILTRCVLDV